MLKYIGDFDKLKDYGFKYSFYEREDLTNAYYYSSESCDIGIIENTRKVVMYWASPCNDGVITIEYIETINNLIKDGLVIKEEEK